MSPRIKGLSFAAAIAAMAVAIPTGVQAYADPTPSPEPTPAPATPTNMIPAPSSTKVPDPQGSGCDAYRSKHPAGSPGSIESMALQIGSQALASNPELSTFSAAISAWSASIRSAR